MLITFATWGIFSNREIINIPILLSKQELPIVRVDIEGKEYPLELALKSKYPLFLNTQTLNGMHKSLKGKAEWKNFNGQTETSALFEISDIQLGGLKLKKILAISLRNEITIYQ